MTCLFRDWLRCARHSLSHVRLVRSFARSFARLARHEKSCVKTLPDQPGRNRRIANSVASFCAATSFVLLFDCAAEPCRVTCANATLDMNCDSSFPVHKHEKILRHNPLKTSEISKLLKSNKSLKEKFSFHLKTLKKQRSYHCPLLASQGGCDRRLLSINEGASNAESAIMVEPGGIEPPTSCVQGRRSPS